MDAGRRDPVASREAIELNGFRVERVRIRAGGFPVNAGRRLRIIATLGSGWDLRVERGERVHYDHGEIVLLPAWLQRESTFRESGDNLLITADDALVRRLAGELDLADPAQALPFQKLTDPTVYQLVAALVEELAPAGHRGPMYTEAVGVALLGHVLRGHLTASDAQGAGAGLSPRRLHLCQQYIEQHLGDRLAVDTLASLCGVSSFHFTRAFKKSTGKTPHRYVLERRLSAAQLMVGNTIRPLNEIAAELGFRSASHFSAVFAEHAGCTPSAYRRRSSG